MQLLPVAMEKRPELIIEEEALYEDYGMFCVEPLPRGYGITLGNALRRVLLSSIEGTAPTRVTIEGVLHELQTIPGVREDVLTILLTIKRLAVRFPGRRLTLVLDAKGPKEVTARDFKVMGEGEILNPELYIATLADGAKLRMQIECEKGFGYKKREEIKKKDEPIGVIVLDADFSPVKKVAYRVEEIGGLARGKEERLVLEIWTNKVVHPKDAFYAAVKTLIYFFSYMLPSSDLIISALEGAKTGIEFDILNKTVEEIGLSARAINALKKAGVITVRELVSKTEKEILSIKNLGKKTLEEIKEKLQGLGLYLKEEEPQEIED